MKTSYVKIEGAKVILPLRDFACLSHFPNRISSKVMISTFECGVSVLVFPEGGGSRVNYRGSRVEG